MINAAREIISNRAAMRKVGETDEEMCNMKGLGDMTRYAR
jgi:hypothetical protein